MNYDALLVVNQDTQFRVLGYICKRNGWRDILLLTSHGMFPQERSLFTQLSEGNVTIMRMAQVLAEDELDACDEVASTEVLKGKIPPSQHSARMLELKNAIIADRMLSLYTFGQIVVTEGLGIVSGPWVVRGAGILSASEKAKSIFCFDKIVRVAQRVASAFRARDSKPFSVFSAGDECYIFFTNTKRLVFETETPRQEVKPLQVGVPKFLRTIAHENPTLVYYIASTIHEYSPSLLSLGLPVVVFVDGYHPPNYNRTYIDCYKGVSIVANDPFSAEWFKKFGWPVRPAPSFIKPAKMAEPLLPAGKTFLLALNHAGDWTAIINRSDTDLLVEEFARLAERFPHCRFCIRPHPTMIHPAHEGLRSKERLREFVDGCALPNLSISMDTSLEQDLQSADVIFSEYSQALISAWLAGKCGASVNVTARRSFMAAYHEVGFPEVASFAEWCYFVNAILQDPETVRQSQAQAVRKYNAALAAFYVQGDFGQSKEICR